LDLRVACRSQKFCLALLQLQLLSLLQLDQMFRLNDGLLQCGWILARGPCSQVLELADSLAL
jgi:hypothetical protein